MSHPCDPKLCRVCRPGRPCATTVRWLQEERELAEQLGDIDSVTREGRRLRANAPARYAPSRLDMFGVDREIDPMEEDKWL